MGKKKQPRDDQFATLEVASVGLFCALHDVSGEGRKFRKVFKKCSFDVASRGHRFALHQRSVLQIVPSFLNLLV